LSVRLRLATVLAVTPEAVAMALTVKFEATKKGARYSCEEAAGVLSSKV
jgi:hypothetical protein